MSTTASPVAARRSQAGFSLAEMMVATAVFLLVILAAYQVFQRSNESYKLGQNQAEMVQGARVGFDQLAHDVRLAGFEFDADGEITPYPNQPDEPIEYMHARAIVLRANFDFDKELRGREPGLEVESLEGNATTCCPVVTTANDEIVGYALAKPPGTTQPTGSITFKADISGTLDADDDDVRDAYVDRDDDSIVGEETVTIGDVELSDFSNPPYTLYRFQLDEDGTVIRQPLVDNVRSISFTYFDESNVKILGLAQGGSDTTDVLGSATVWGNDNGFDGQAGRAERWRVRRVRIDLETMTPERDLALMRAQQNQGSIPANMKGIRTFTMEEDIAPPNLGRRGSRDRDTQAPQPVRNVTVCAGQCRMVRVSWEPGPPEDRVTDYIVTLCNGVCDDESPQPGNAIPGASFIVIPNFDPTTTPYREYAVFTSEDSGSIDDGDNIGARVVARNVTGTESECPVTDCVECCQSAGTATVDDKTRLDAFYDGTSTGYDAAHAEWPDARADNGSGVPILTDAANPSYPAAHAIRLEAQSPAYVLNVSGAAGTAPFNWTTKNLGSGVTAAMDCYKEESTPATVSDDPAHRTPAEEQPTDPQIRNVYVFRVSASDPWNWCGREATPGNPCTITDPRNFVPGPDNLVDFTTLNLRGPITWTDFADTAYAVSGNFERWDKVSTNGNVAPLGNPVHKTLVPGELYFYRLRAVDICWSDKNDGNTPPNPISDGIHDSDQGTASPRTAWMTRRDFTDDATWRQKAMEISPFYPPLNVIGDSTNDRDRFDQAVHDADAFNAYGDLDTFALPGYALPALLADGSAYIPPEAPSEFYLAKVNDTKTDIIDFDGDGAADARVVFNASRRNAPPTNADPAHDATYTRYRLYRRAATSATPSQADMEFNVSGAELVMEFRTSGPVAQTRYTLDTRAEGAPTAEAGAFAALRDLGSDFVGMDTDTGDTTCTTDASDPQNRCLPYIYRLAAIQATDTVAQTPAGTVPGSNDGIDTTSGEISELSRPFLFPCEFYDLVKDVETTVLTTPNRVDVLVEMVNPDGTPDPTCEAMEAGRLLAFTAAGEFIGSSDWVNANNADGGDCASLKFNNPRVNEALRGYGGSVRYEVEISNDDDDIGRSWDVTPTGCRVRSDFLGEGADLGPDLLCNGSVSCADGVIFGALTDADVTVTTDPSVPHGLEVRLPVTLPGACGAFEVREWDFHLTRLGGLPVPEVTGLTFVSGFEVNGLPAPAIVQPVDIDTTPAVNGRVRWYHSFCADPQEHFDNPSDWLDDTTCAWPTVAANATEVVVLLEFADDACDVNVSQLNFRVAVEAATDGTSAGEVDEEELICTDQETAGWPLGDKGPDGSPIFDMSDGGGGRGPTVTPADSCADCDTDCDPCQCPVNQDVMEVPFDLAMDVDPAVARSLDPLGSGGDRVRVTFTQNSCSADCDFQIIALNFSITCSPARDCAGAEPLPFLDSTRVQLVRSSGTVINMPPPTVEDYNAWPTQISFQWSALPANIAISNSETFHLDFFFTDFGGGGSMANTRFSSFDMLFGNPFDLTCPPPSGTDATTCSQVGATIPIP